MPFYYFNVSNGEWLADLSGRFLSGPVAAKAHADEMAVTIPCGAFDPPTRIVVTNDLGDVVLQVLLLPKLEQSG
jgi:hypothetical protein